MTATTHARLTELRLTAFKSFLDAALPLTELTVLIGRNGSGKSNALDALEVLSRLAKGEEVRDALAGNRRDAEPVRGGVEGCAPYGGDTFELGVTIAGTQGEARLDVRCHVLPQVQIVWERLCAEVDGRERTLLETHESDPHRADIEAAVWNGARGRNPHRLFRSSHLVTSQLPLRLAGDTKGERQLLSVVGEILAVLGGVFHLDPVPHLMRSYVPEQDVVLRRTAENLSAAVASLKHHDRDKFGELVALVKELPEHEIRSLEVRRGGFGDVMLALKERKGRASVVIPTRQMSDGMLRLMAITTALLTGGGGLAIDSTVSGIASPLMLVIEELENGLHPSQAARLLQTVKRQSAAQDFQTVFTTHSPALLNALDGDDHPGVVVIDRQPGSGVSRAVRLVDLAGYLAMMAGQRLGDAVTEGHVGHTERQADYSQLNRLLGIG